MAQRRMFSKTITNSGKFLKMPSSSRLLYYDLGMNADDDGFAEWFTVTRMTGSSEQDLQVLSANGFIKIFDENVLVILDWKENNYIQKDRYTKSKYLNVYNLDTECIQSGYTGKVRLGKEREKESFFSENPEIQELLEEGSLTLGGEYSSDGRSPLIRRAEKRATEKALGLRKTPELVRFIYKAGWDFRKAFKEAKGDEYEGDVILDQIAKTLVEWHKRGRTTEDIQRLLTAFFRSKKAKENTVTPTSCFSEHTYQSFAQGTLK